MIVNRFDRRLTGPYSGIGVGFQLLETGSFDAGEVDLVLGLLRLRHNYFGTGVVAIDCGANLGVHTVEWAKAMTGWGSVVAIEAQERIYYALAGNIALNNCFNAQALHAAVAATRGTMKMPRPDYTSEASFGSLELRKRADTEFIGQPIDYSEAAMAEIATVSIDSLGLSRVDLIKLDVEGMEWEALQGAARCLQERRPIVYVETIKSDKAQLLSWLGGLGYSFFDGGGINILAVHGSDKCIGHVKVTPPR